MISISFFFLSFFATLLRLVKLDVAFFGLCAKQFPPPSSRSFIPTFAFSYSLRQCCVLIICPCLCGLSEAATSQQSLPSRWLESMNDDDGDGEDILASRLALESFVIHYICVHLCLFCYLPFLFSCLVQSFSSYYSMPPISLPSASFSFHSLHSSSHRFSCLVFVWAEGAENFKKVATDKRSLADVTAMVKKANNKLQELQVLNN